MSLKCVTRSQSVIIRGVTKIDSIKPIDRNGRFGRFSENYNKLKNQQKREKLTKIDQTKDIGSVLKLEKIEENQPIDIPSGNFETTVFLKERSNFQSYHTLGLIYLSWDIIYTILAPI